MIQKVVIFLKKIYIKLPILVCDFIAIPMSWYAAFWLRNNLQPLPPELISKNFYFALAFLTIMQLSCYFYFKTYRGLWRFFSLNDVIRILQSTFTATLLGVPIVYLCQLLQIFPRSLFPLYCLCLTFLLCGSRLLGRIYWDKKARGSLGSETKRVLIIGAGMAGEGLARDLKRTNYYKPLGFIDDNETKIGLEVHGISVLGTTHQIVNYVNRYAIELIFIAIPSASASVMRRVVSYCELSKIPFHTLPSLSDLTSGRVEVNALRPVNIEDLLGRAQVNLQRNKLSEGIYNKRVLVTGGGGSIGSELCRQILGFKPKSLTIVENSEFNLYQIEQELKEMVTDSDLYFSLISITDKVAINHLFANFLPEVVFHAAAYKHVPLLENQIRVAVLNNILGTQIVAKASVSVNTEKFILISSDKAVNPTNIMGATKRVAEIYCQNLNQRVKTQFITVRFGNVLGSTGSVVPLFQKQLRKGGPIKVTHPDVQRYFMMIPEACQLILQAMVNGIGGEIFVLDMGEPIKISYLAEQMIRLAGKIPGKDIHIEYTGLRPGEKLFEELFHESEQLTTTEHEKLFKAQFRELNWSDLTQTLRLLSRACNEHENEELLVLLKSLVPELSMANQQQQSLV